MKELKNTHNIYLLSNTNAIHEPVFLKIYADQMGKRDFEQHFTKVYYSHKINLRKPNEEIYRFVLNDVGINAEESFFIDDSYPNIESAKLLGIKTHLLLQGEKIEDLGY